jgi:hypothetical protein
MRPNVEEAAELEEILTKRLKSGKQVDDKPQVAPSCMHHMMLV